MGDHPVRAAGEALPAGSRVIEVRVPEVRHLFNEIDPSPFHDRDLDPRAEAFIVDSARDLPTSATLALRVLLERSLNLEADALVLQKATRAYFMQRSSARQRELRDLFRRGRLSLVIALLFLAMVIVIGDVVVAWMPTSRVVSLVREGLIIVGWVAMWRPLEVFLYDWWPIRGEVRLYDRLARMPVRVESTEPTISEAEQGTTPGRR